MTVSLCIAIRFAIVDWTRALWGYFFDFRKNCKNAETLEIGDTCIRISVIIPRETEGYRFELVRPSVCPSHLEGGYLVVITSPSLEVPRVFSHSYSLQPRIVDVHRQGFNFIGLKNVEITAL